MTTPLRPIVHVGIDVSKATLDVYIDPVGKKMTLDNSSTGTAKLVEALAGFQVKRILLEATGRYDRRLAADMIDAGFNVTVVNPRQARDFAKALGKLAKSDSIDAKMLAEFAKLDHHRSAEKTSEKQDQLDQRVTRRRQVVEMLAKEKTRLEQTTDKPSVASVKKVIRLLEQQREDLDRDVAKLIESDEQWAEKARILDSAPGVGPDTANQLVADLPELGNLNRGQIASLVGLAPFDCDSGTSKGERHVRGGRTDARTTLYMATFNAVRCNPVIKVFAERLKAAGKSFKVVMTACMRKLLTILNAMAKSKQMWNENNLIAA